jgi:hypothetical protein
MSYYQEGHNENVKSYRSAQTPWKIFYSPFCLLGQIYPTKSDIFFRSQKCGSTTRLDISDPMSDISNQPDLSSLHWVPEPWQLPRSDISDPRSDISGLHQVPVPCHPPRADISEPHQIYPTQPKLSHFESPIRHIWSRSDISDVLTPPTVINVWGLYIGPHSPLGSTGHSKHSKLTSTSDLELLLLIPKLLSWFLSTWEWIGANP